MTIAVYPAHSDSATDSLLFLSETTAICDNINCLGIKTDSSEHVFRHLLNLPYVVA